MTACPCHAHNPESGVGYSPDHRCTPLCTHSTPECVADCVHCFDDGTPVYPHDAHEPRAAYLARQEANLIREALAVANAFAKEANQDG